MRTLRVHNGEASRTRPRFVHAVQRGLAPECVVTEVVDALGPQMRVALSVSPLVMRPKTGVAWSSKQMSSGTWTRKYAAPAYGGLWRVCDDWGMRTQHKRGGSNHLQK